MAVAIHQAELLERFRQARLSRDKRFDGQFFVAVKSTGIFCRPICPAKLPKEENVDYYHLAAQAMHAGFRPCLRCRPDSAPQSPAWNGVATTVTRATQLLADIPPKSVADIASRLGISTRYLHKLLEQHTGCSPSQWQKYHQLLFAKQLLQQSSLPVEQVADAAGFGSARRLQSAMRNTWSLTPSQLRKTAATRNNSTSEVSILIHYRKPYNWAFVRDFLAVRAIPDVETLSDNAYSRVYHDEFGAGHLIAEHLPERAGFRVTVTTDYLQGVRSVLNNLARVLDLNIDPTLIAHALADAGVQEDEQLPGLRLPGVWSAFEAGCRAVLGQQVSVKAAIKHVTMLAQELGVQTDVGRAFPTPKAVADSELTFLKMPQSRKLALRALAQYFVDGAETDALQFGTADAEAGLLALKGIGPWTVDYLMLRGYSQPDRFLGGDLVVRNMMATRSLTPEQAAPWRSYLTLQLWQLASKPKVETNHV